MVGLAIWLVSAFVVLVFVLWGFGLLVVILSEGRWKYALGFLIILVIWAFVSIDKQNREWEQKKVDNLPLYNQCVDNVRLNSTTLYYRATEQHVATQQYINQLNIAQQSAENNCGFKYPH